MKLEFVANFSLAVRIKKSEEQVVIRDQPKKGGRPSTQKSVLSDVESKHTEVEAEKGPSEDGFSDSLHLVKEGDDKVLVRLVTTVT